MAKFKVGDRVRVASEPDSMTGRPEPSIGIEGVVVREGPSGPRVKLDQKIGSFDAWEYTNDELDLIATNVFDAPTLRDQFAMAALISATEMAKLSAIAGDIWTTAQIAECAYQIADAMIAERERAK